MGNWVTTVLLWGVSMLGAALMAGQGFRPDPLPQDTELQIACDDLTDDHARAACLDEARRAKSGLELSN